LETVDKLRESSIDLQFPHLTPLFSRWRQPIEAKGIPPHVSLLYPWRTPPLHDRDIEAVQAIVANRRAFPITFSAIGRFPSKRVLHLKIEDNVPLRALMQAIHSAFPETPPYRGEHRVVIPHLTIATADNDLELDQLEQEVSRRLQAHLPLSVEAQSVIVAQENPGGIWSTAAELPLLRQRSSSHLDTEAGLLTLTRAGALDFDAVMAILREAADWLTAHGIPQWKHWHTKIGERLLRDRIENHEVYLARRAALPVATVTIQWEDTEFWGERGLDRLAGYVHGIAITRQVGGMRVGERLLEWTLKTIAAQGKRLARLDTVASNARLCRYYEDCGFRPLGTVTFFDGAYTGGMYTAALFEKDLFG
jgi:2'-5' RNA ligase